MPYIVDRHYYEGLFAGQTSAVYEAYLQIHAACRI